MHTLCSLYQADTTAESSLARASSVAEMPHLVELVPKAALGLCEQDMRHLYVVEGERLEDFSPAALVLQLACRHGIRLSRTKTAWTAFAALLGACTGCREVTEASIGEVVCRATALEFRSQSGASMQLSFRLSGHTLEVVRVHPLWRLDAALFAGVQSDGQPERHL